MITFVDEERESMNEWLEKKLNLISNKLNHLDYTGNVKYSEPHHMGGKEKHLDIKLTRRNKAFPKDHVCPVPKEPRKLTELDWLNIMNYYKMLFDGFKGADWNKDSVREQVASAMIKKTKKFFEDNYPDLIEKKKKPIFDKGDFE